jgi:O-antigen ligase
MLFKDWKIWFKALPKTMKWFVWLVLLRPIIDSFYFLKDISPILSPLYIVGVMTPVLIIWSLARMKRQKQTQMDTVFKFFAFFVGLGIVFVGFYDLFSQETLEMGIKLSLPLFLFYYLRRFIRTKKDLDGILQSFLYSAIFVGFMIAYELAFGAIRVEESRGFDRIQGYFGDVVSYGIYIVFSFLIVTYFYFSQKDTLSFKKRTINILVVALFCVLGLINMYHVASYLIFAMLLILFFVFNMRTDYNASFVFAFFTLIFFVFWGQELVLNRLMPLFARDQEVLSGAVELDQLAHGRMGRWKWMWQLYTSQNILVQLFGYPVSLEYPYSLVGSGAHNDYMRTLFLSGYLGLLSYLGLIGLAFKRSLKAIRSVKYLAMGAIAILSMFSISITPTYYPHFMYLVMAIFSYLAIPQHLRSGS